MKRGTKIVLGIVAVLVAVPAMLVVAGIAAIYVIYEPNATNGTINVSGEEREYLLYVPKSYDAKKPTPLVVSLHAAMNSPAFQRDVSRWNRKADENGFIVVYPAGMGVGVKTWFMHGLLSPRGMPDVRFISALVDKLQAQYNIDPARIYADGLSNGGGMAYVLSCRMSDRIAAVGAVSSAQSVPFSWCKDERPVPVIMMHGSADPVVPYGGGQTAIAPDPFPAVRTFVASWAKRNRCAADPVESKAGGDVVRTEYTGCADNAAVVLYTVNGAGHQWFGGKALPEWCCGRPSDSIDATSLEWAFFRDHPLAKR